MEEAIYGDILKILERMLVIFRDKDYKELSGLSDNTIHNASIFQDEDSVSIAVIVYAISKIIGRYGEKVVPNILPSVEIARKALANNDLAMYKKHILELLKNIADIDNKLKRYIDEVIIQAEIKKGSRLYEHGISMARAAEILGVSEWELMSYVGKTRITDFDEVSVGQRLGYAREIFGLEKK